MPYIGTQFPLISEVKRQQIIDMDIRDIKLMSNDNKLMSNDNIMGQNTPKRKQKD